MTQDSQASSDQVVVECSSLPPLQAFLERQPEVRAVTRSLHVSDALLNPDTIGLVAPRFDLVVHLAERPKAGTATAPDDRAAPILKKVAEWATTHGLAETGEVIEILRQLAQAATQQVFPAIHRTQ